MAVLSSTCEMRCLLTGGSLDDKVNSVMRPSSFPTPFHWEHLSTLQFT